MRLLSIPGLALFSKIIAQTRIRHGFFNWDQSSCRCCCIQGSKCS